MLNSLEDRLACIGIEHTNLSSNTNTSSIFSDFSPYYFLILAYIFSLLVIMIAKEIIDEAILTPAFQPYHLEMLTIVIIM